jgi:hypothetical protein
VQKKGRAQEIDRGAKTLELDADYLYCDPKMTQQAAMFGRRLNWIPMVTMSSVVVL